MLKPGIETTRTRSPYFSPNSAGGDGVLRVLDVGLHRGVVQDLLVDDALDLELLIVGHGAEVNEVEAQPIWRDERPGLLDVWAEHTAERGMKQVSGSVIASGCVANIDRDARGHEVAWPQRALGYPQRMTPGPRADLDDAGHSRLAPRAAQRPDVGHLAARLEVEGRLGEHHEAILPLAQ